MKKRNIMAFVHILMAVSIVFVSLVLCSCSSGSNFGAAASGGSFSSQNGGCLAACGGCIGSAASTLALSTCVGCVSGCAGFAG